MILKPQMIREDIPLYSLSSTMVVTFQQVGSWRGCEMLANFRVRSNLKSKDVSMS